MASPEQIAVQSTESKALIGLPTLMGLAFAGADLNPIADALLKRIESDQNDANALMDMHVIQIMRGNPKLASAMQNLAMQTRQIYQFPRPAQPIQVRALAILGPGDLMANSPFEFLIQHQPVTLDLLYVGPGHGIPAQVPDHDVLLVAVAESDANQALLAYLAKALANWPRPVLNRPERISRLARDTSCALLAGVPGLLMPGAHRIAHSDLEACCTAPGTAVALHDQIRGVDYPVIIRPVDSHAGQDLSKIDNLHDLTAYLAQSTARELFVSQFVDYRSADGRFRKYRIILIDGEPFVCHMAISGRWMVHYLNADMLDNPHNRAEEAAFMASFEQGFAQRHQTTLREIHSRLGLDYVGLDCAETTDGQLLIFEADSNMVVHDMDPADTFPYKKQQMPKLFAAFAQMLARKGGKA